MLQLRTGHVLVKRQECNKLLKLQSASGLVKLNPWKTFWLTVMINSLSTGVSWTFSWRKSASKLLTSWPDFCKENQVIHGIGNFASRAEESEEKLQHKRVGSEFGFKKVVEFQAGFVRGFDPIWCTASKETLLGGCVFRFIEGHVFFISIQYSCSLHCWLYRTLQCLVLPILLVWKSFKSLFFNLGNTKLFWSM